MVKEALHPSPARDVLLAAIAVAVAAAAGAHAGLYPGTFNSGPPDAVRTPPVAPAAPARAADTSAAAARVALVVVDGLREDAAGALGLEPAAAAAPRGPGLARCTIEVFWPSYSRPSYATIGTGAPPALTGVHTNRYAGPVELDSIFAAARNAKLSVGAVTDGVDFWGELFPAAFDAHVVGVASFARESGRLFEGRSTGWDLALLHTVVVDAAGHEEGTRGALYARAVEATGAWLRAAVARLDPARDTLVVTSDHGHLDRGGHGGTEAEVLRVPLFVLGRGARPVRGADACPGGRSVDVAPTVAALLGVAPPKHATGRVLREVLSLDGTAVARTEASLRAAQAALALPEARGVGWAGGALGLLLAAAFAWLLQRLAGARSGAGGAGGAGGARGAGGAVGAVGAINYARTWLAAVPYPLCAWIALLAYEPGASFSAAMNDAPRYALRLFAILSAAAVVGLGAHVVAFAGAAPALARRGRAAALALAAASWPVVVGLHGSPLGGPRLGHPALSFGVILSAGVAAVGCGYVALLLLVDAAAGRAPAAGVSPAAGRSPRDDR